ncbi:glycosyltransferase family 2 protein, partial [Synechococcus sp. H55.2]|uniref:glycosyltransferase family 2 protein n=1 Tax=unclassified Synechococcus TaxID=2626047 RepID=UPI0039C436C7
MARVCIVTTVRDPGVCLESFIRYHLAIGIAHIYIFFDDPEDPAAQIALRFSDVTAIPNDEALQVQQALGNILYAKYGPHVGYEVMARQILNVETAIQLALDQGMDWIIHIDGDELFYLGEALTLDWFDQLDNDILQVRFLNYEAAPEKFEIEDYFREVTLFKRNPAVLDPDFYAKFQSTSGKSQYFLAYQNGKSAARVYPSILPNSVHSFDIPEEHTLVTSSPTVLHYLNCGFQNYYKKYAQLGNFPDYWWRSKSNLIRVPFHLRSRDAYCSGDINQMVALYQELTLYDNPMINQSLVEKGILTPISYPSQLLAKGSARLN